MSSNPFSSLFNTSLSVQQFLDEYWQKKPLLIRQAFANFTSPVSNEELAGLACEAGIESRLIIRDPAEADLKKQWTVRHGPFTEEDFSALPDKNWTLLVQDVDKWLPPAAALLQSFRFIPDWRVDDLMISYAEDGGSVGAHWDNYDVFLIQGSGQRRWQIEEQDVDPDNVLRGPAIRLLKDFNPSQDWTLNPGDMLYLPPRLAHLGVAIGEDCQTLSVGFRAPAHRELVDDFTQFLVEQMPPERHYNDTHLDASQHPAELTDTTTQHFQEIISRYLKTHPDHFQNWLGAYLTVPKPGITPIDCDPQLDAGSLLVLLAETSSWSRDGASRFVFSCLADKSIKLFINGQMMRFSPIHFEFIQSLCRDRQYNSQHLLAQCQQHDEIHDLCLLLVNQGHLYEDE